MIKLNITTDKPSLFQRQTAQDEYDFNIQESLSDIERHFNNREFDEIEIKRSYYGKYKDALWRAQYKKCAFCEEEVKRPLCDVEHFRPFKYSINLAGERKNGIYSWLGYEWLNYQIACKTCNGHKSNHFPLVNEQERVEIFGTELSEDGELGNEEPILINPRFESPDEYISYYIDDIRITGQVFIRSTRLDPNGKGTNTIRLLDLNREETNKRQDDDSYDDLPGKRGERLLLLIELVEDYKVRKTNYDNLSNIPGAGERQIQKSEKKMIDKREQILKFMTQKHKNQFIGLSLWYLRTQTSIWNDLPELHNA